MSVRTDIIDSIEAAQADRRTAQSAGDADAFGALHREIVAPVNEQLARLALRPRSDAEELQALLATLDAGLAVLEPTVPAEFLAETRAQTERVRFKVEGSMTPQPSVNPVMPDAAPVAVLDTPDPIPDGPPGRFVNARYSGPLTVLYVDGQGREVIRQGGTRAWRNNNPGNIRHGNFADLHDAIGSDGSFAIFPDEQTGIDAVVALLHAPSYNVLSLEGAIARYAPPVENDTGAYVDFVVAQTGIEKTETLGDLRIDKIRAIASAIKAMEGWRAGSEQLVGPTAAAVPGASTGVSSAVGATREWMEVAEREAALPAHERSEWPDPGENPRILEYFRVAASWFDHAGGDETDWCAAFVNYCLAMSGHLGTNHPGARSFFWNKHARFVRLSGPRSGCIAVRRYAPFDDERWSSGPGHVGFVTSFTATNVTLLGGNQGKTVCRKTYQLETRDASGAISSKFVSFLLPSMN